MLLVMYFSAKLYFIYRFKKIVISSSLTNVNTLHNSQEKNNFQFPQEPNPGLYTKTEPSTCAFIEILIDQSCY
jgi:hypothetical protein